MNIKKGFFWHVPHDKLVGWCFDYAQPVRGELPHELVEAGRACDEAHRAREEARRVYDKAYRVFVETCYVFDEARRVFVETGRACDKAYRAREEAGRACDKAYRAYGEAGRVYNEARRIYDKALIVNRPAIEALHARECPDCPWDGRTIFPNGTP